MQEVRSAQRKERAEVGRAADNGARTALTDEWTKAALAHASVLLTLILGLAGGVGVLVGPLVPLAIYLAYRERSRFVAFHALQSLAYHAVGVLIYTVVVTISAFWAAVAWTISGVLSFALVGLLLIPFALMITLMMALLLIGTPLAWLGYGLYAAYRVYQGYNFRYWMIGEWLEERMKS